MLLKGCGKSNDHFHPRLSYGVKTQRNRRAVRNSKDRTWTQKQKVYLQKIGSKKDWLGKTELKGHIGIVEICALALWHVTSKKLLSFGKSIILPFKQLGQCKKL